MLGHRPCLRFAGQLNGRVRRRDPETERLTAGASPDATAEQLIPSISPTPDVFGSIQHKSVTLARGAPHPGLCGADKNRFSVGGRRFFGSAAPASPRASSKVQPSR